MEHKKNCAVFGPSGADDDFAAFGHTATIEIPKWVRDHGLDLFEYSFGRGVRISKSTAEAIGEEANAQNVEISVHAPYFINFASVEQEKADNSIRYLTDSLQALKWFGGRRCVFHPGSEGKQPRAEAFARTKYMVEKAVEVIKSLELDDLYICPETMGKLAQIGTVDEVIELCKIAPNVYPCVDFGHVNCVLGGALKSADDFQRIIDKMFDGIGEEKTKNMHVHFSKIMYTSKGEVKHLTFEDTVYGPEFEPLGEVIAKNNLTPHILSESAGTQTRDAAYMQSKYLEFLNN
ncbi:MAG: TIM barrel protein [Clostridia bacterium]|nr:TIM barrel protein [Clostridia bacterium]